ncbi:hypothetical protein [Pseudomonas sp. PNPG3]|uniref:hypothetical protein n=1 Tax=Pseudomonas sp. PNPG3 TaxID=2919497 RepID=UPI001FFD8D91|nr:hypothetical protein [Pseudomonas sp. PNPG3]MCK2122145.1 hypothetical protein [Pseudomonas sp. PNPG3]
MKITFDGAHVRYEPSKGKPQGSSRAPLPRTRVHWTGQIQLKDGAGNAVETTWSTPKNQRMNYIEVRAAVFAIVYNLGPDSVHFTLVSR